MLMDLFHDQCDVGRKQRVHFHKFMLDVHQSKSNGIFGMYMNCSIDQIFQPKIPFIKIMVSTDETGVIYVSVISWYYFV